MFTYADAVVALSVAIMTFVIAFFLWLHRFVVKSKLTDTELKHSIALAVADLSSKLDKLSISITAHVESTAKQMTELRKSSDSQVSDLRSHVDERLSIMRSELNQKRDK